MNKIRYITLLIVLLISTNATSQNRELVQVVIANEGNFGSGNATLTNFLVESSAATDGVFLNANGVKLGDTAQSTGWIDGKLYVVVNNSQKIVIVNVETFQQTGQISFGDGASPREILQVSEDKAYVTDLYAGGTYVVDLSDNSVSEILIPSGLNPDRLTAYNGYAYIANNGFGADSTIFKVDIATDQVVDTLEVSRGPGAMHVDSEGTLWVVCAGYSGDYDENWNLIPGTSRPGGLHGIDLETGEEVAFDELPSAGSDLVINEEDGFAYVNAGGIRAFDISEGAFAPDTLIKGSFYAMGYDEVNQTFYLADAKDFSSAGEIIIHGEFTEQIGTFDAGIIPGDFQFVYSDMVNTSNEPVQVVESFSLEQNYPNPFNPTTNIQFSLEKSGFVKLEVFSSTGQKVVELINGVQPAGQHSATFDASALSSGVYIYRLQTGTGSLAKKMILLK